MLQREFCKRCKERKCMERKREKKRQKDKVEDDGGEEVEFRHEFQ